MKEERTFENVFILLKRHFIAICVIGLIGAAAGAIFSMPSFMPPRYESTAVVYPMNIHPLSDENETEQMMQLFSFNRIRDAVIDKFELYERHGLVPGAPEYKHWVKLLYDERVSIRPTRYESVQISCQDEDPEVAKQMVEEILHQFNQENRRLTQEQHQEYVELKEREYRFLSTTIDSLEGRMMELRSGTVILDMEGQSESLTDGYVAMLEKGVKGERLAEMKQMIDDLGEKGSTVEMIQSLIEGLGEYHALVVKELSRERTRAKDKYHYAKVVVEPEVADKKSYPVRWLIVVISAMTAVIAAIVFFAIRSRFV